MGVDERLEKILREAKTIAVVGLSDDPSRASFGVSRYLQRSGYRIIPVNPHVKEVHGEKAVPSLDDLPVQADIIDVFRRPEYVPDLVEPALRSGAKLFWMQVGVENEDAAHELRAGGITVVQDRCLMVEHMRLVR